MICIHLSSFSLHTVQMGSHSWGTGYTASLLIVGKPELWSYFHHTHTHTRTRTHTHARARAPEVVWIESNYIGPPKKLLPQSSRKAQIKKFEIPFCWNLIKSNCSVKSKRQPHTKKVSQSNTKVTVALKFAYGFLLIGFTSNLSIKNCPNTNITMG